MRNRVGRRADALARRADLLVARLPVLAAKARVYDDAFYAEVESVHEPMYVRLAEALCALLRPSSIVDVGCGTDTLLSVFASRGARVVGVEGSRRAIAISPIGERIVRWNLERGVPSLGRFDLCLCIEVAEHLPARHAARLVEGLAGLSDLVVFSAATPGQGGVLHLNEQEQRYWTDLFSRHGLERRPALEDALGRAIADVEQPSWMHENLIALCTPERASSLACVALADELIRDPAAPLPSDAA